MAQDRMEKVQLVTEPTITVLADLTLKEDGIIEMAKWVKNHRPNCGIDLEELQGKACPEYGLLPHDIWDDKRMLSSMLTDNEVLCELAGRKCYDSFGDAAGRPTNKEYLQHIMEVKHNSVLYHAKMVFFFGGISRRLSHELIRTYVGADRENDGSPSQESTRFTYHYGFYIAPPRTLENEERTEVFRELCQENYDSYCNYVDNQIEIWEDEHEGQRIPTMERKRIFEDAAGRLLMQAETSLIWTTNPVAITKQILERTSPYADREYQRFARMLAKVCVDRWPNLFPEPIHKIAQEEQ